MPRGGLSKLSDIPGLVREMADLERLEKKSQPSESEIRELWEWCGFKIDAEAIYTGAQLRHLPLIRRPDGYLDNYYPPIDLNSLFKYAVPKAVDTIMAEQQCSSDVAYAILFKKWLRELELDIPDHEGTLFWALWKVREEEMKRRNDDNKLG